MTEPTREQQIRETATSAVEHELEHRTQDVTDDLRRLLEN